MDRDALLVWYQEIGVQEITASMPQDKITHPVQTAPGDGARGAAQPSRSAALPAPLPPASAAAALPGMPDFSSIATLPALQAALEAFEGCDLKKTALHTVFSDGVETAKIMVIGEAPGADEDRIGKPFVGLSGQLLDAMFAAIGLSRQRNLYITNTIPWRPPGNRNPTAQELKACLGFLHHHIRLQNPDLIILVGGVSAKTLLNSDKSMSQLRGQLHDLQVQGGTRPIPAFPLYHPAYLLRSPGQKRHAWKDLLILKQLLKVQKLL